MDALPDDILWLRCVRVYVCVCVCVCVWGGVPAAD